jgi:Tim10/DDP family zinc finger
MNRHHITNLSIWFEEILPYSKVYLFIFMASFRAYIRARIQKGDKLDSREQSCLGACQDRYLETRTRIQEALERRQASGM